MGKYAGRRDSPQPKRYGTIDASREQFTIQQYHFRREGRRVEGEFNFVMSIKNKRDYEEHFPRNMRHYLKSCITALSE